MVKTLEDFEKEIH